MTVCTVVGHVWATKKENSLSGLKLMVVREERGGRKTAPEYVAADLVSGSTARRACGGDERMVDSAIVGIIDSLEVDREQAGK